ncbi:hypothetical protein vseg_000971 [Gypsophila vaccaria]
MSMRVTPIRATSPSLHHQGINSCFRNVHISRVSNPHPSFTADLSFISPRRRRFSLNSDTANHCAANGLSDSQNYTPHQEESVERQNIQQEQSWSTTKVLEQLKRYGVSGILSYGLLNTAYYLTTFLTVWFYFAPAPGKMGYLAAVSRFLKVMAMVWAGSQVTKLIRAAGALALAPIVDKGLSWFTVKFKFDSQGKAFFTIVGFCFGLAFIMFIIVTLLSA